MRGRHLEVARQVRQDEARVRAEVREQGSGRPRGPYDDCRRAVRRRHRDLHPGREEGRRGEGAERGSRRRARRRAPPATTPRATAPTAPTSWPRWRTTSTTPARSSTASRPPDTTPTKPQAKCEDGVAKNLIKFAGAKGKCYDKCVDQEFKGKIPAGSCTTGSPSDARHAGSASQKAEDKAAESIDKVCERVGREATRATRRARLRGRVGRGGREPRRRADAAPLLQLAERRVPGLGPGSRRERHGGPAGAVPSSPPRHARPGARFPSAPRVLIIGRVRAVLLDLDETTLDDTGGVEGCWAGACPRGRRAGRGRRRGPGPAVEAEPSLVLVRPGAACARSASARPAWTKIAERALESLRLVAPGLGLETALRDFAACCCEAMALFPDALPRSSSYGPRVRPSAW